MTQIRITFEPDSSYPFKGEYPIDGLTITERGETLDVMLEDLAEKVSSYKELKFKDGETTMEVDW